MASKRGCRSGPKFGLRPAWAQQLMAGARKWRVDRISRNELAALTEEAARVTGIPYIMDVQRQEAMQIIDGKE
ncbi:MAG: hypothetical protein R6U22_12105 [Desulfohalobiaceae bacterium]